MKNLNHDSSDFCVLIFLKGFVPLIFLEDFLSSQFLKRFFFLSFFLIQFWLFFLKVFSFSSDTTSIRIFLILNINFSDNGYHFLFCFIAFDLCSSRFQSTLEYLLMLLLLFIRFLIADSMEFHYLFWDLPEETFDSSERIITGSAPVFIGITLSVLYLILPLLWFYYTLFFSVFQ